jgi:pimeloyl-ACP methyl ester carboxylesterase
MYGLEASLDGNGQGANKMYLKRYASTLPIVFSFVLISYFLFMIPASFAQERRAEQREHVKVPEMTIDRTEKHIDVGGRKLHCCVYGTGTPAVILISGFRAHQDNWNPVITDIAALTTVVTYDRAGYGESELGNIPTDGKQTAKELKILLQKLGISDKVILVGHSYGGRIARIFASMFPDDMAGLILEDTSYDDMRIHMRRILTGEELEFFNRMESMIPKETSGPGSEQKAMDTTWKQCQQIESFPHIPFTVLTAGILPVYRGFSEETANRLREIRLEGQKKMAELIPGGKHQIVEGVGHGMHMEKPEVLIKPIVEMVNEVRKNSR